MFIEALSQEVVTLASDVFRCEYAEIWISARGGHSNDHRNHEFTRAISWQP
jgi:hypothetical protein